MNVDEQNDRNRGSMWLLFGLIILVGVVVVVYGIIVSSETENVTVERRADTIPLVEDIPEILGGMSRFDSRIKELEEEVNRLNEELEETKQIVVDITEDMLSLSQTIAR